MYLPKEDWYIERSIKNYSKLPMWSENIVNIWSYKFVLKVTNVSHGKTVNLLALVPCVSRYLCPRLARNSARARYNQRVISLWRSEIAAFLSDYLTVNILGIYVQHSFEPAAGCEKSDKLVSVILYFLYIHLKSQYSHLMMH